MLSSMRSIIICLLIISFFSCKKEKAPTFKSPGLSENQHLRIRLSREPDALSPILARSSTSRQIYRLIFGNLLQTDPTDLKIKALLATQRPIIESIANSSGTTFCSTRVKIIQGSPKATIPNKSIHIHVSRELSDTAGRIMPAIGAFNKKPDRPVGHQVILE